MYSLNVELIFSDGDAVDKLEGGPEPVELGALVDVHHSIGGRLAMPDGIILDYKIWNLTALKCNRILIKNI